MSDNMDAVRQTENDTLQVLTGVATYLHVLVGEDSFFSLSDMEKYIYVIQGKKMKLPVENGSLIKEGSIADATIKSGDKISKRISKELYGIPYIGMGIPIRDAEGRIIGTIAIAKPIEIQEKVSVMAEELNNSMENISTVSANLMSASEQLAATAQELAENTTGIERDIKEMDGVIALIKEVSDQTHLLGLNAAIEAARAGEHGRGFNVVAEEIRKLASKTQNSVKEISSKLKHTQEAVLGFTTQTHEISSVSQQQAASTEEITASMQKIEAMAEEMARLSEELIDV